MYRIFTLALALFASAALCAEEPAPAMLTRGKLLVSEDLSKMPAEFKAGKGKWEIVAGVLRGTELKDDAHAATFRRPLKSTSTIVQFSIKFEDAKTASVSINSSKGHLSRLLLTPTKVVIKKDSSDKNQSDKAELLDNNDVELKPGEWHTFILEQAGKEIVATLDGHVVGYGLHMGLDLPISNIGFTVTGGSASFKNLRIWEGTMQPSWPGMREKLAQGRVSLIEIR